MATFSKIDLSKLPEPEVVEQLDYETVFSQMLADLIALDPTFSALIESDPAYKILQVAAYRELVLRQRNNDASLAVMLAYAKGSDLDNIAARYNVKRLILDPGDENASPPISPKYEDDDSLRRRVQLAFESISTAGPSGAYIYHALGAHSDVKDASVSSPAPVEVHVTVLSREGDGVPNQSLQNAVLAVLDDETVRPLTDKVTVKPAQIISYQVAAEVEIQSGPDRNQVLETVIKSVNDFVSNSHRLGNLVGLSGLYAALHQEGVQRAILTHPSADIEPTSEQAAYCTSVVVTAREPV